ncbi:MAG: Hsp33 family molecular chaperone HslO [Balneolaceae bacterium]
MSLKERFQFKDRLIKGIDKDGQFKISVVKTTDVVQTAKYNHGLSLLNSVLLGRTLTASMLLASELKGEERIRLKLEGSGPVGMLVAEANRAGEIRGYSQNPAAELDYSSDYTTIGDGLGAGLLTVSKTLYNEAEPRTSTIELASGDVIADVAHYMAQSEQVLSAVLLDVSIKDNGDIRQAGGLLIQRLPEADESSMEVLQENLLSFPAISDLFQQGEYIDSVMERAARPFTVKELDRQPVHFFCRCTPDRFKNALSMLSYEDLKDMKGESQEIVCHYCGNKLMVSEQEIGVIAEMARAKLN